MALVHLFADESGNLDFERKRGATRYFVLATVAIDECSMGNALLELRRSITMDGFELVREFHATDDHPQVRRKVFDALAPYAFRVDATIFEKPKTSLRLRVDVDRFYRMAWYLHLKRIAPQIVTENDDLFAAVAQFQTKTKRQRIHAAINEVCREVVTCKRVHTAFWPASADPCLQIADCCSWAIFRKWEHGDETYYRIIHGKVASERDAFSRSQKEYY